MVTETLARIYEKQGNLPKAIDAYYRLALKYPEKGAYFAALAKVLEEQSTK
jgi:cytochrome c-type biogenesis protein CcmH/NrfG